LGKIAIFFGMKAPTSRLLASGPGWSVSDVVCTAGPYDRPFEERHESACIAAVTAGSFQYRTRQGAAVLAAGAVLLGNDGAHFECGHEHGTGDRCLSFHFMPDYLEAIVAAVPGARRAPFDIPRLPPSLPVEKSRHQQTSTVAVRGSATRCGIRIVRANSRLSQA
jgi:AraC family transcriptional regulator